MRMLFVVVLLLTGVVGQPFTHTATVPLGQRLAHRRHSHQLLNCPLLLNKPAVHFVLHLCNLHEPHREVGVGGRFVHEALSGHTHSCVLAAALCVGSTSLVRVHERASE